jgi:hypothetical protein
MPIRAYLDKHRFDAETTRLLGIAFETTVAALRQTGIADPPRDAIAKVIILTAKRANATPRNCVRRC